MTKEFYSVGDILLWRDAKLGHNRMWEVESILLGAEGVEGLVRLRPMFHKPGMDEDGKRHETVLVPECLLRDLEWFAKRTHNTVQ
jgi:hypothetical protein